MTDRQLTRWFWIIAIAITLSFFYGLGHYPLSAEEPRRALIALEMFLSNDWLNPTLHGEPYYRKPPLYNWTIAAMFGLLNNTAEWVVRLPAALSFVLLGLAHFFVSKRVFGIRIAVFSTIMLWTFVDLYLYFSRLAEMDLFFSLLMYPSIILPYIFANKNRWLLFWLIPGFFAGLGFLAKGMPAIAFWGISTFVALALTRSFRQCLKWLVLLGPLSFLLPVMPYFLAYAQQYSLAPFLDTLLLQSADRTTSSAGQFFVHLLVFPLDTLKNFLPYTFLLLLWRKHFWHNSYFKALIFLFLANYVLYWVAPGGRGRYIYPLFPIAALVLAYVVHFNWSKLREWFLSKWAKALVISILVLGYIPVAVAFGPWHNNMLVSLLMSIFYLVLAKQCYQKATLPFALLLVLFTIRMSINAFPDLLISETQMDEKAQAQRIYKKYQNVELYYNTGVERHYNFVYELTRLRKHVIEKNNAFSEQNAVYLLLQKYKPPNAPSEMETFTLGDDRYVILQHHASEKSLQ